MKKIIFLIFLISSTFGLSGADIIVTGKVTRIYPQNTRVYFKVQSTACHNNTPYKYYYFDADKTAIGDYTKTHTSFAYFQLLLMSASSSLNLRFTVLDEYVDDCGVNSIPVKHLRML